MKAILGFALVPVICGVVSTALFVIQGGFGGGHGTFDFFIFMLGLPSTLIMERVPLPSFVEQHDILLVIWLPVLMYTVLFASMGFTVWLVEKGWDSIAV